MWQQKIFQKIKIFIYLFIYIQKNGNIVTKKIHFFIFNFHILVKFHTQKKKTLMLDNVKVVAIIKCL
jgi:hypothetical protein